MSERYDTRKNTSLATTSLVLGILGCAICGIGVLAGIAAVYYGHKALGKIQRAPYRYQGRGRARAGLILGYISIALTVVVLPLTLPAFHGALAKKQAMQELNNARYIGQAIRQMARAGQLHGDKTLGYPADIGITTATDLRARLTKGNYLSEGDAEPGKFNKYQYGNVSDSDPANTIVMRILPTKTSPYLVIFQKSGDGMVLLPNQPNPAKDPPRNPPYLAP